MQDDIRPAQPGRSTGPLGRGTFRAPAAAATPSTPPTTQQQTIPTPTEPIDEAKITEEFGPPPMSSKTAEEPMSIKQKISKLLPAFTVSHRRRRPLLLVVIGALIILFGAAESYIALHYYVPFPAIFNVPHVVPKPKLVPSTLTGLLVDPSVNSRQVTAVMIENSLDARPQSGLDQAGVVFEALAEGGVTRFMALYQDTTSDYLGPVRSARPYYIQWLLGFDAAYAHVGGSPDGLQDISDWHVKDLNQFYNAGAYQRITSRYAPHNVYTSIGALNQLEAAKDYISSSYTGFTHKKEAPSKTPTVTSIDINFSGYYYDTHYDYDAATNTYKRSESGAPHIELHKDGTKVQIAPKVVVAMIVPEQNGALDSSGAYYADYAAIGSGKIEVFQDGTEQSGSWSKASNTAPLVFTDANGKPLALNAGQAWIAATPLASNVTYK